MRTIMILVITAFSGAAPAWSQADAGPGTFLAVIEPYPDTIRGIARYVRCADTLEISLARRTRPQALLLIRQIGGDTAGQLTPSSPGDYASSTRLPAYSTTVSIFGIAQISRTDSGTIRLSIGPAANLTGFGDVWASAKAVYVPPPPGPRRYRLHMAFNATPVSGRDYTEYFGDACRSTQQLRDER